MTLLKPVFSLHVQTSGVTVFLILSGVALFAAWLPDIILSMLLTLCCIIGVMMPFQTLFQKWAGIELTLGAMVTQTGSFILLALWAIFLLRRFYNCIKLS